MKHKEKLPLKILYLPGFFFPTSKTVSFYKTKQLQCGHLHECPSFARSYIYKNKTPGNVIGKRAATQSPVAKQQQDVFSLVTKLSHGPRGLQSSRGFPPPDFKLSRFWTFSLQAINTSLSSLWGMDFHLKIGHNSPLRDSLFNIPSHGILGRTDRNNMNHGYRYPWKRSVQWIRIVYVEDELIALSLNDIFSTCKFPGMKHKYIYT